MKRNFAASSLALAGAISLPLLASPVVASADPAEGTSFMSQTALDPNRECKELEVIDVPGTGASSMELNPYDRMGSFVNFWLSDHAPANMGLITLPYPAVAGDAWAAMMGRDTSKPTMSYGESRAVGEGVMSEYMAARKAHCSGIKFGLSGYSQGADVAGNVGNLVSQGKITGVSPEDIVGTVLIGDPGRSKVKVALPTAGTLIYSKKPFPAAASTTVNNVTLFSGDENAHAESKDPHVTKVGVAGARTVPFKGQEARVISFCHPLDAACSVQPGKVMSKLAQLGIENANSDTAAKINNMAKSLSTVPGIGKAIQDRLPEIQADNYANAGVIIGEILENSNVSNLQLLDMGLKIAEGLEALKSIDPAISRAVLGSELLSKLPEEIARQTGSDLLASEVKNALNYIPSGNSDSEVDPDSVQELMDALQSGAPPAYHAAYLAERPFGMATFHVDGLSVQQWSGEYFISAAENLNTPIVVNTNSTSDHRESKDAPQVAPVADDKTGDVSTESASSAVAEKKASPSGSSDTSGVPESSVKGTSRGVLASTGVTAMGTLGMLAAGLSAAGISLLAFNSRRNRAK